MLNSFYWCGCKLTTYFTGCSRERRDSGLGPSRNIKTHGALFPGWVWFVCLSKPNLSKGLLFDFCGLLWSCGRWQSMIYKKYVLLLEMENVHFPHLLLILYFYQKMKNIARKYVLREVGCGITVCKDTTWTACCSYLTLFLSGCLSFKTIYALLCKGRAEDD